MLSNFDEVLAPRTYCVRGYKRRKSFSFTTFLKFVLYFILLLIVAGVALLSVYGFI